MKNILIISATPRKNGNSDVLCDQFMKGAEESGNKIEKIRLKDKEINYCIGCGVCIKTHKCTQKDDTQEILEKMIDADVIVLATPVYFYTMNAQMKTLIDRCCSEYTRMDDKEFYFIMTAADPEERSFDRTVESFRAFTSCLNNPQEKGIVYGAGAWHVGEIQNTPAMDRAYKMGQSV